jgi:hypothetical protein
MDEVVKRKIPSQHLPGLEPPIIQPVVQLYTTELSRLLEGKRPLGRNRRRWEVYNRMDLREIE